MLGRSRPKTEKNRKKENYQKENKSLDTNIKDKKTNKIKK